MQTTQNCAAASKAPPRYRSDIAGNVRGAIADFECGVRNELAHSEEFIFSLEDTHNYEEWKDYLTTAEMMAAFRRAQQVAA